MSQPLSGKEFAKALQEGSLKMALQKEGLVKQEGSNEEAILFSPQAACQNWISIPVELIERVEYLRPARCRDHEHPFVRLFLKEPQTENVSAYVLAELLRQALGERFDANSSVPGLESETLKTVCCDASVEVVNRATGKHGFGDGSGIGTRPRCESAALRQACKQAGVDPQKTNTYRIVSRTSSAELCD